MEDNDKHTLYGRFSERYTTLDDLELGHLFYLDDLGKFGVKTKTVPEPEHYDEKLKSNTCVTGVYHQLIAPEAQVCPLGKVEDFTTDIGVVERNIMDLSDVEDGVVFELPVGNGLIHFFCATNSYVFTGRVCLHIDFPATVFSNFSVHDKGYAGTYTPLSRT